MGYMLQVGLILEIFWFMGFDQWWVLESKLGIPMGLL
jgi:hypothetical protein